VPDKLPEEFAPAGPKLSKFPIQPAPPVRPHLFPDEARFALRLAVLAGGAEFAAWAWLAASGRRREILALAGLRLLKPLWAWMGTRVPRPAVAFALLLAGLFAICASVLGPARLLPIALIAAGLPAVADLCATCVGDSVTVERRAAAYAWLDMGQALGAAVGLALGGAYGGWALLLSIPCLLIAAVGIPQLRDRDTPRSSWPAAAYVSALISPIGKQLTLTSFACGLLAGPGSALWEQTLRGGLHLAIPRWMAAITPLVGMAIAARLEPRMRNAMWLPRAAIVLEGVGGALGWPPLLGVAMGVMFGAIPAAVARGVGEMERPLVSSLAWSALFAGAAVGAVL